LLVDRGVETKVGVGVGNVDRLAGCEHASSDADGVRELELRSFVSFGHQVEELHLLGSAAAGPFLYLATGQGQGSLTCHSLK